MTDKDTEFRKAARDYYGDAYQDKCELCSKPDGSFLDEKDMCMASLDGTFLCTRIEGHDGQHAACGLLKDEHPMAVWGKV